MPHPERTLNTWNWGWMPADWNESLEVLALAAHVPERAHLVRDDRLG